MLFSTEAAAWTDCKVRFQTDGLEKQILQVCSAWPRADGEEGMSVPLLSQGGGSCRNRGTEMKASHSSPEHTLTNA